MPDSTSSNTDSNQIKPPMGDFERAEKYITQLINLIKQNKLLAHHTDLTKFDPSALEDHYRLDLADYQIEISHSKQPDSGKDLYIMLFNNTKLPENSLEKTLLAYMYLTPDQFQSFKTAANNQIETLRKEEEEKRLQEALSPIDQALAKLTADFTQAEESTGKDDVVEDQVADNAPLSLPVFVSTETTIPDQTVESPTENSDDKPETTPTITPIIS